MQPKLFRIKPGGFREIRTRFLLVYIPLMLAASTSGILIAHYNTGHRSGDTGSLFIAMPVFIIIIAWNIFRSLKRQKELFESFSLAIDGQAVVRVQKNLPQLTLPYSAITRITKQKNGCISINTARSYNCIQVPAQIENYEQLEAALNEIKPLEQKTANLVPFYCTALVLLVIALFAGVGLSHSKPVIISGSVVLGGILLWSMYATRKSPNVDQRTKKRVLWVILVVASVMSKMLFTLFHS
jgi:hypothetical protein